MKLGDLGEDGFLAKLAARLPAPGPAVVIGIGDDAAALAMTPGESTLVATDVLVEGVHFSRDTLPPRFIGRKAVAVNASDIAAMGGRPVAVLCSLLASREEVVEDLLELFDGLTSRARELGCDLVGGNLSSSATALVVDVMIVGVSVENQILRRSGARAGDALYLSGKLGASAEGLALLRQGMALASSGALRVPSGLREGPLPLAGDCLRAHVDPEPRVELGLFLSQSGVATSCIDVSDGFAKDLSRLCRASGVGARIEESALPVHPGLLAWERLRGREPLELALAGGEDYELLFTVRDEGPLDTWRQRSALALTRIGEITEAKDGVVLSLREGGARPLEPSGWDHFERRS